MDELQRLRTDLIAAGDYTAKYRRMFKRPGRAWGSTMDSKYNAIQETLKKIRSRGRKTEHYTALEKTPLLVSDVFAYLWEIIDFMQCRTTAGNLNRLDPSAISPDWHIDEESLIRMEQEVKDMLTAITPTGVVDEITHLVHHVISH
jgi:hypothetical protein